MNGLDKIKVEKRGATSKLMFQAHWVERNYLNPWKLANITTLFESGNKQNSKKIRRVSQKSIYKFLEKQHNNGLNYFRSNFDERMNGRTLYNSERDGF